MMPQQQPQQPQQQQPQPQPQQPPFQGQMQAQGQMQGQLSPDGWNLVSIPQLANAESSGQQGNQQPQQQQPQQQQSQPHGQQQQMAGGMMPSGETSYSPLHQLMSSAPPFQGMQSPEGWVQGGGGCMMAIGPWSPDEDNQQPPRMQYGQMSPAGVPPSPHTMPVPLIQHCDSGQSGPCGEQLRQSANQPQDSTQTLNMQNSSPAGPPPAQQMDMNHCVPSAYHMITQMAAHSQPGMPNIPSDPNIHIHQGGCPGNPPCTGSAIPQDGSRPCQPLAPYPMHVSPSLGTMQGMDGSPASHGPCAYQIPNPQLSSGQDVHAHPGGHSSSPGPYPAQPMGFQAMQQGLAVPPLLVDHMEDRQGPDGGAGTPIGCAIQLANLNPDVPESDLQKLVLEVTGAPAGRIWWAPQESSTATIEIPGGVTPAQNMAVLLHGRTIPRQSFGGIPLSVNVINLQPDLPDIHHRPPASQHPGQQHHLSASLMQQQMSQLQGPSSMRAGMQPNMASMRPDAMGLSGGDSRLGGGIGSPCGSPVGTNASPQMQGIPGGPNWCGSGRVGQDQFLSSAPPQRVGGTFGAGPGQCCGGPGVMPGLVGSVPAGCGGERRRGLPQDRGGGGGLGGCGQLPPQGVGPGGGGKKGNKGNKGGKGGPGGSDPRMGQPPAGGNGFGGGKGGTSQRCDLFVGRLAEMANEQTLRTIFNGIGLEIKSLKVPVDPQSQQPKGYAFVTLVDPTKTPFAIQALNGQLVNGRTINVEPSTPMPGGTDVKGNTQNIGPGDVGAGSKGGPRRGGAGTFGPGGMQDCGFGDPSAMFQGGMPDIGPDGGMRWDGNPPNPPGPVGGPCGACGCGCRGFGPCGGCQTDGMPAGFPDPCRGCGGGRGKGGGNKSGKGGRGKQINMPFQPDFQGDVQFDDGGARGGKGGRGSGRGKGGKSRGAAANTGNSGVRRDNNPRKLFVGNLSPEVTMEDIAQALSPAGEIVEVRVLEGKYSGIAFVEFKDGSCVDRACTNMRGVEICGRPVRLEPQGSTSNGGSGGQGGKGGRGGSAGGCGGCTGAGLCGGGAAIGGGGHLAGGGNVGVSPAAGALVPGAVMPMGMMFGNEDMCLSMARTAGVAGTSAGGATMAANVGVMPVAGTSGVPMPPVVCGGFCSPGMMLQPGPMSCTQGVMMQAGAMVPVPNISAVPYMPGNTEPPSNPMSEAESVGGKSAPVHATSSGPDADAAGCGHGSAPAFPEQVPCVGSVGGTMAPNMAAVFAGAGPIASLNSSQENSGMQM